MEELMQYVWQFRLWPPKQMATVDGMRIDVIDPGILNRDAGPDFFNAKVMIGQQLWIGNIEMHVRASDWHRHGHDNDPAYDSVVLHVVEKDDAKICRSDGQTIPQMVMTCARDFSEKYNRLVYDTIHELQCSPQLKSLPQIYISDWISALAHERLFTKSDRVLSMVKRCSGNWTEAIYITLARALGFSTNSEPFELLALSTPLKCMMRHSDSIDAIQAILFGQAGLLPQDDGAEGYPSKLRNEYAFYAAKYGLKPSSNIMWKMARMRPQNFPHRRIAALAHIISGGFPFSSAVLDVRTEEDARRLLDVQLTGYWTRHFTFAGESTATTRAFSKQSANVLIINAIIPFLYAFGESTGDVRRQEIAKDLLQSLAAESNSIIDLFARCGIVAKDAFTSQALIQLRREYCQQRKCLFCRIGHKLLSQSVVRTSE